MSYRIEDNIVIFQFDYDKVNSIHLDTLKALDELVNRVNNEEELKGIILTGTGKYFSGGFDLNTFTSFQGAQDINDWFAFEEDALYNLFTCKKPVVAAVNGHATAAGLIVTMATDYRIAMNHPKIKVGMTEIKIGLALTPAEAEIMRFGLDTDKNFRDIIFSGELINPSQAYEKGIFDELVDNEEELMAKAKAKVVALIDTPGRPFILLKSVQKKHAADNIKKLLQEYDMDNLVKTFTDKSVVGTLTMVKNAIGI
jgi:enoyl-CoA hydratase/carnithine racemase